MTRDVERFLKRRTEALVKAVGVERACQATGKSKTTLGRYYSTHEEHAARFMPVDAVAQLETAARVPHVSSALADLAERAARNVGSEVDVRASVQRVTALLAEFAGTEDASKPPPTSATRDLPGELATLRQALFELELQLAGRS